MLAASRLAAKNLPKYVFYGPSMRHFANKFNVQWQRSMATMTSQNQVHNQDLSMSSSNSSWHHDPKFPLPGNVGIDMTVGNETKKVTSPPYQSLATAFLELGTDAMHKQFALSDFIKETKEMDDDVSDTLFSITDNTEENSFTSTAVIDSIQNSKVEFKIQECPPKLRKQFNSLFSNTSNHDLTIITITQQTEHDMSTWSEEVEDERNLLTDVFIESAKKICLKIQNGGYWADFIDPSSGLAFNHNNQNNMLNETDDCFNQIGFHVEDLGCCKVLQHKQWKNNAFVGVIFTNAPVESHVFELL